LSERSWATVVLLSMVMMSWIRGLKIEILVAVAVAVAVAPPHW
jgi:hypothetical protein